MKVNSFMGLNYKSKHLQMIKTRGQISLQSRHFRYDELMMQFKVLNCQL